MTNLEKAGEISTGGLGANRAGDFEENFHGLTRALLESTRDFQDKVFIDVISLKEFPLKYFHGYCYISLNYILRSMFFLQIL